MHAAKSKDLKGIEGVFNESVHKPDAVPDAKPTCQGTERQHDITARKIFWTFGCTVNNSVNFIKQLIITVSQ